MAKGDMRIEIPFDDPGQQDAVREAEAVAEAPREVHQPLTTGKPRPSTMMSAMMAPWSGIEPTTRGSAKPGPSVE